MSILMAAAERILQARQTDEVSPILPWHSYAEFVTARIDDPRLRDRSFLIYYDDDRQRSSAYTYAEFGTAVLRTTAFLQDRVGLRRGSRLATVLFNHDLTVVLYFAAWTAGITVVPINIEEPIEKKRYILE